MVRRTSTFGHYECRVAEAGTVGWSEVPVLCADVSLPSHDPFSPPRYSDPTKWTAFLGLLDQGQLTATGVQKHELKRIISHPSFNDFTFDYDIALLELKKPAEYSAVVQPICLPDAAHVFPPGKAIWVTGWGHTEEGGECLGGRWGSRSLAPC